MKYKDALVALFAAESIPLFNNDASILKAFAVRRALVKGGLISTGTSICCELEQPIKTTQVFAEATGSILVSTKGSLGQVVRFTIGDWWVFFDATQAVRLATMNRRSMKLWA